MCDDRVVSSRLDKHTDAMLDVRICCSQRDRTNYTNFVRNIYFRTVNTALSASKQLTLQQIPLNVCTRHVSISSINYSMIYNCLFGMSSE